MTKGVRNRQAAVLVVLTMALATRAVYAVDCLEYLSADAALQKAEDAYQEAVNPAQPALTRAMNAADAAFIAARNAARAAEREARKEARTVQERKKDAFWHAHIQALNDGDKVRADALEAEMRDVVTSADADYKRALEVASAAYYEAMDANEHARQQAVRAAEAIYVEATAAARVARESAHERAVDA